MAKKEIELLEKRVDRLEKGLELMKMQIKELKSVDPDTIDKRFKSIEETLYSTKEILNMKDVCNYLDISQSMLYKLTCNGEIPHFKPRGKTIFFEKKELIRWIKKNGKSGSGKNRKSSTAHSTMKKKTSKKNSIDGANLPDSLLVELLDRCVISVKGIKSKSKKKDQNGKKS